MLLPLPGRSDGNPAWTVRGTWSAAGYEMVNTLVNDYADGQLHREILGTGNSGELFHWAGGRMIGETNSSGTFVRSFVQQPFWDMGGTLAEAPGSNPATASYRYFEPDEHGTPRVLRDQNKAMLAKFEYMPYGEPLSSAGMPSSMGYTGMWQSCNSCNVHFPLRGKHGTSTYFGLFRIFG